ncbi:MAG TPA: phage holin family protein [Burkholderiaceae bacterium]|nr:phage holin family protein [Burkholderiaceae bacterium]
MSAPAPPERLAVSLRGFSASLVEFLAVRLELVSVEAREEALRLAELLLFGAIAILLLGLGLSFLAILLTVLLWDSHRLLALAVFATVFLTLGGVAAFAARARLARGSRLFGASLAELERDRQSLRP